jgi:glc operon protein GlcG
MSAKELNIRISASICDAGGRPVTFQRMDNAIWASAYASQGKAVASAAFGRPSGEMADRADQPTPRGIAAAEGGHMIMGVRERFRSSVMASRAPVASAAAPVSKTKTAPAPASPQL